ncbi:hypothetical protein JMUB7504_27410 [Staphylococcus aureus]
MRCAPDVNAAVVVVALLIFAVPDSDSVELVTQTINDEYIVK